MNSHASPATELHDVVVVNEQTGVTWPAGAAAIEGGEIVVRLASRSPLPPEDLFARRASTFTITATDGAGRQRSFPHTAYAADRSTPPNRWIFR